MLIDEVKAAYERATPGPWRYEGRAFRQIIAHNGRFLGQVYAAKNTKSDGELFALAPDMARKLIADEAKLIAAEEMKKALELMIAYCNAQPGTMGYPGTEAASALTAYRKAGEDNAK